MLLPLALRTDDQKRVARPLANGVRVWHPHGDMGLFDIFGGNKFDKHAKRAANKKAQAPDRWQSLQYLSDLKTPEAVEALLQRFAFRIDPSITDQSEKDLAMKGILAAGPEAIEPVRAFLRQSDAIAWPVRMLQQLVDSEQLVGDLLELLESMGTEYERDPQKKIDLIMQLEDHLDPRIRPALERFLQDANENVRFHAVSTILRQEDAAQARERLLDTLLVEEGVRVRVKILDGFLDHGWDLGDRAAEVQPQLPDGYVLDGQTVRKR